MAAHLCQGSDFTAQPALNLVFSPRPQVLTMDGKSQRPRRQDGVLSSLNAAIDAINIAKDVMDITPAKAVFGSISVVLTMIRVGSPDLRRSIAN